MQVNTAPNPIEMELLAQGVAHRVIYEEDAVNLPGRWNDIIGGIEAGEQARVVPRLPAKVLLIDDRVALLPAGRVDCSPTGCWSCTRGRCWSC